MYDIQATIWHRVHKHTRRKDNQRHETKYIFSTLSTKYIMNIHHMKH